MTKLTALDIAYGKINALGGHVGEYDDHGKGVNCAVDQALRILEELGARDPAVVVGLDWMSALPSAYRGDQP